MEIVSEIGGSTLNGLSYIGSLASLGARAAYYTLVAPFRGKPLRLQRAISQAMDTGVRALPILSLITFFIGLILALQAAYELRKFGAISAVATAVAVTMSRELGPLITAIVVIGRSGSAFAAELGTMKVSEEIDALETMAISPIRFLVAPKFLAMMVMLPCLSYCHLYMIGVLPEEQGKGLASALMNPIIQRMKEKSIPVFLETANLRNVDIYKKKGFKIFKTLTIGDQNLFLMSTESPG